MKKLIPIISLVLFFTSVSPVWGAPIQRDLRKEIREEMAATRSGLLREIGQQTRQALQKFLGKHATIVDGVIKNISGQTLTVTKDDKDYTVTVTASTKLRRRFWGKATLTEFSTNDHVSVYGKWTNDSQTAIEASLIRNLSIQKLRGTFFGTITSINGQTFTLKSVNRGDQTVTVTSSTKIVNRKMQSMTTGDLKVNDRVRVKGLWDNTNKTITEVTQVKDFSQPVVVSPTPKA